MAIEFAESFATFEENLRWTSSVRQVVPPEGRQYDYYYYNYNYNYDYCYYYDDDDDDDDYYYYYC